MIPVEGLPLIRAGDHRARPIVQPVAIADGDILCLASRVWSRTHGNVRSLDTIEPSARAPAIAARTGEETRFVQAVTWERIARRFSQR